MNILLKLETNKPPNILYKYVAQEGLLGICHSNSVWATDIFYMNDAAEYRHASYLMKRQINERLAQLENHPPPFAPVSSFSPLKFDEMKYDKRNIDKFFLESMQRIIDDFSNFHIFVCSFTEENDLLSQWRGYCPKGNGYSIGFNTSLLVNAFKKKRNYKLVKCIYDTEKQFEIINELLQKSLDKIPVEEVIGSKLSEIIAPISTELFEAFIQIAPMFKDSSFSEEKEWRFVSRPEKFGQRNVKYRQGVSMIIPYDEINILTNSSIIPVENIVIGPTQHKELSKKSINGLLKTKGIDRFSILLSRTPYRDW